MDTIGAKVVLDGAKGFMRDLSQVNAELKLNQSALKFASTEAKAAGGGLDTMRKSGAALSAAISGQSTAISKLSQLQNTANQKFGEGSRQSVKVATALNEAKTKASEYSQAAAENSKKMQEGATSAGSLSSKLKDIASVATGMKLLELAIRQVVQSIGAAVERYDTISRYPRVLAQMGYSAEASKASMNKLTEGVKGLPTSLNDIIQSTQKLATVTGDLDTSTDTALALNNAFLASGASAADASRGATQYIQQLSKGKVDMMSWRTLQETMGYALRQTAESMGYTGKAATNDLYNALQKGDVTFDQFNAKLIELSTKTGGFAEQARNASAGIGTSMTNMQTAIVRGVTAIIDVLNSNGAIQSGIESVGVLFEGVLNLAATLLYAIEPIIAAVAFLVKGIASAVDWLFTVNGANNLVKKSTDDTAKSTNDLTKAFGSGTAAADDIASAGEDIAESYDSASASVKQMSNTIYDTMADARKAAQDYNKQFSDLGYRLVQDAEGRAKAVSNSNYRLYENLKEYIDKYYAGASESEKVAIAKRIYGNREMLTQIKKDFYNMSPEAGRGFGSGVAQGISNSRYLAENEARKTAQAIKSAYAREMDQHSPSKAMEEKGRLDIMGLVNGYAKNIGLVKSAIKSVARQVKNISLPATVAISGYAGGAVAAQTRTAYYDYSDNRMTMTIKGIEELDALVDWWQNKRRRERAAGSVV